MSQWIKGTFLKKGNILYFLLLAFFAYKQVPLVSHSFKQTGQKLKPYILKDLNAEDVKLPLPGKKAYLFWATWCAPCHVQMEMLEKLVSEEKLKSGDIIAISLGEKPKTVAKFLKKRPFSFKVLVDPSQQSWKHFKVKATPSMALVNENQEVDYFTSGLSPFFALRLSSYLD